MNRFNFLKSLFMLPLLGISGVINCFNKKNEEPFFELCDSVEIINGKISKAELQKIKDSFDDEDFKKCVKFMPLPILEPMLNSVIEDLTKRKK